MKFLFINSQIWLKFLAKYWHFWPIWSHGRPKNDANKVHRWFSVGWVPNLLLPPVEIRNFVPKTAKFEPKICICSNFGIAILIFLAPGRVFFSDMAPRAVFHSDTRVNGAVFHSDTRSPGAVFHSDTRSPGAVFHFYFN